MEYTKDEIKFDFDDIVIEPAIISDIVSRKGINPYYFTDNTPYLPLMASPMDTVIDEKNLSIFTKNRIPVCIPRGTANLKLRLPLSPDTNFIPVFKSYSLEEF